MSSESAGTRRSSALYLNAMSNRCQRCGKRLGPDADPRRRHCSDRCRWVAAAATFRERHRASYNSTQSEVMRRRRLARRIALVERQARFHDEHKFEPLAPSVALAIFAALLKRTAAWDEARGIAPYKRWLDEKKREEQPARR